jgi:hypothetical protein
MDQRGAPRISFGFNAALVARRVWAPPLRLPRIRSLFTSRGLLEFTMRDMFRKVPNVEVLEDTEATQLIASPRDNRMVCHGVEIRRPAGAGSLAIEGNLVFDASGGHAKSRRWLEQLGLTAPEEKALDPLLTYTGQWLRMRDGAKRPAQWWWAHGMLIQRVPRDDFRGAHLMKQQADRLR